jgi:hypothetical protein
LAVLTLVTVSAQISVPVSALVSVSVMVPVSVLVSVSNVPDLVSLNL